MYPNIKSESQYIKIHCPKCDFKCIKIISSPGTYMCDDCLNPMKFLFCEFCQFRSDFCERCYSKEINHKRSRRQPKKEYTELDNYGLYTNLFLIFCVFVLCFAGWSLLKLPDTEGPTLFHLLRAKYPSQIKETWIQIFSALDKETPTVKSLILLYKNDKQTVNCLSKDLVSFYTDKKDIEEKEVTFSNIPNRDYGEVLEFYRPLVKKNRILVTDLNEVAADTARIFHSLCDEVSSDTKPSLFIFTLQYGNSTSHLKRVEKASNILKHNWSSLPGSDLFPLLSRIVKNVVEVTPEADKTC